MKYILLLFLVSCGSLFYQPHQRIYTTPDKYQVDYKEITFSSIDGTQLTAWLLTTKVSLKGTVVFFHGNAENISTHFFQFAWLTRHGYQVFIFDYRGYGKSQGTPSKRGIYLDAQAALIHAWNLHQKEKFIVVGQSLGGIIAVPAIRRMKFEEKIDLVVLDSTFDSYQGIAFDKMTDSWLTYIFSPLAYLLLSDDLASRREITKLKSKKVLVLHGTADQVVPSKHGIRIFQKLTTKKDLKLFEDASHIQAFAKDENRVWFVNYLDSHL